MDDYLRKQIEEALKRIDEQPSHTTEEGQRRIVHVYLMDGGSHNRGRTRGRRCIAALPPLPKRALHWIGVCILLICMGFLFSLFPVITITTTTISSPTATITMQQSTLGPTGSVLVLMLLTCLMGFLILGKRQN